MKLIAQLRSIFTVGRLEDSYGNAKLVYTIRGLHLPEEVLTGMPFPSIFPFPPSFFLSLKIYSESNRLSILIAILFQQQQKALVSLSQKKKKTETHLQS